MADLPPLHDAAQHPPSTPPRAAGTTSTSASAAGGARTRASSRAESIPSILVSPSSPTQPDTQLSSPATSPLKGRSTTAATSDSDDSETERAPVPDAEPATTGSADDQRTEIEPVMDNLTISTRAASPPPSGQAPTSALSALGNFFLPSGLSNVNFSLSSFGIKMPGGGQGPTMSLVERRDESSSEGDDQSEDGGSVPEENEIAGSNATKDRAKPLAAGKAKQLKVKTSTQPGRASVDLDIRDASSNGRTYDDEASPRRGSSHTRGPSSSSSSSNVKPNASTSTSTAAETRSGSSPHPPPFSQLHRTPSSAFVAAQQAGQVHPLTLHAVARRESEADALRVVRDRVERQKELDRGSGDDEKSAGGEGVGGRPGGVLKRKDSWARLAGAVTGGGGGMATSESKSDVNGAGNGSGTLTPAGRGSMLVHQEVDEDAHGEDNREINATGPSKEMEEFGLGQGRRGPSAASASEAAAVASTTDGLRRDEPTVRKRSFFSRFGGGGSKSGGRDRGNSSASALSARSESSNGSGVPPSPVKSQLGDTEAQSPAQPKFERSATNATTATSGTKGKERETIKFAKVKTKNKATKDFGKLFLAQELFIPPPGLSSSPVPSTSETSVPPTLPSQQQQDDDSEKSDDDSPLVDGDQTQQAAQAAPKSRKRAGSAKSSSGGAGKGRKKNAVWTIKFSDDGRYLAVGGKDGIVRVWEALSTKEARQQTMSPESTIDPSSPVSLPPDTPSSPASTDFIRTPTTASFPPTPTTATADSAKGCTAGGAKKSRGSSGSERTPRVVMPVFSQKPLHEFRGHEADVLDLSWSKNNFLLSSSMDKTVRLWHVSRKECLCAFQHLDFVTSIAFHPKDDRFFLSGSLDCKLRLWNIPEKRVHIWTELAELITSVAFTRDGKLAIAGSFVGICMFFEVETFRYHTQISAKSSRGRNSKGRKVTSMTPFPLPSTAGDRLLITSNDSRVRLYHLADKSMEAKYSGHENTSSQIRASFSDDGQYIISGSEDRCVYIWESGLTPKEGSGWSLKRKSKAENGYESFALSANIVTCACFAPNHIRELLAQAGDPIFGDGQLHLAPLAATLSGASLAETDTLNDHHLVPVNTTMSETLPGARDAIIVTADDETGVISIFRNSVVSREESSSSKKSKRLSRVSTSDAGGR